MNRITGILLSSIFMTALILTAAGCDATAPEESFYEMKVPPEKLHSIENISFQGKKQDANRPGYIIDVNKPEPNQFKISIEQCRAYTLENNLDLKVQLIAPAIAAEQVNQEDAKFEAAFYSNIQYGKTDTPTSTTLEGTSIESESAEFGVKVPLKTGGTVTVNLADNRIKTDSIFSTLNPAYSSDLSLSISQPLLRGAGKRANTYAIRVANYNLTQTEARTKLEVIRVVAAADRVYWRLYAARRNLEVRRKEVELAEFELEHTKRLVQFGTKPEVEVVRAEAGVASRLEGLIIADNELRDREREAKQILNIPSLGTTSETALIPSTEPDPVRFELNKEQMLAKAVENRMEMLELELQIAQQTESIDYYKNSALPLVNLVYTYKINGLGPTRNDSYDLLFDKRFEDHFLGFNILVPLGNEDAKSRVRQAFSQRKQSLATKESRRVTIETEVLRAIDQLDANWQRILAGRQNAILAGKVYEAEKRQYEKGLRTMTEVLDAQTKYADAETAEIQALTEYQIAQVDLAYATGTILGSAKVRWDTDFANSSK